MKNFAGKVAAITGAASGIGRSLAVLLAARGTRLALADKDEDGLAKTRQMVEEQGAICSVHPLDVSDRAAVEAFARDVVERHQGVDLLFNNAGVTLVDRVELLDYEDFHWLMNINFWGVVYGTKAFLPFLRRSEEAHIVNVSSLFGLASLPLQSAYCSSKFAVRGFTESLKMELAGSNISVSCIHPGGIKTDIARNSRIREESLAVTKDELLAEFDKHARTTAGQAAEQILRGVERKRRRVLIGPDAKITSLIVRIFPGSYERILGLEKKVRERAKAARESARRRKNEQV
jgi:butyryl-CoA dehydrogenase